MLRLMVWCVRADRIILEGFRMSVTVTRPAPKRRASPPREPRVRKQGLKPFRDKAFARIRILRGETFLSQFYRCLILVVFIGFSGIGGVWLAREAEHRGEVALAAYDFCSDPRPVSHISACSGERDGFGCLAKINDRNRTFVRICHPEALRS